MEQTISAAKRRTESSPLSAACSFLDYYRCPGELAQFIECCTFNFANVSQQNISQALDYALKIVEMNDSGCVVPFSIDQVADHLRLERYVDTAKSEWTQVIHQIYYALRPAMPVGIRRHLQRAWLKRRVQGKFPHWPVDCTVDAFFSALMQRLAEADPKTPIPFIWFWPRGHSMCATMTHDVETENGLSSCQQLMDSDASFAIPSSFQLIPNARYNVTSIVLERFRNRGFEVNVHDWKHDGHLFESYQHFADAARNINEAALRFGSNGFRSGALYRNQDWLKALQVSYDMSVPNAAHFDPQPGGCCTVMPYFTGEILELPVTTTQDYSLFHVLNSYSTELWCEQIAAIQGQYGLASFIVHPDYLNSARAQKTYRLLLEHLSALRDKANIWIASPGEVNSWWRRRSEMSIVRSSRGWQIEGPDVDGAVLAYAAIVDGKLQYSF